MKIKAKEALGHLLQGKTLFHVNCGQVKAVIMEDGVLKEKNTKLEWSFSDFNMFATEESDFTPEDLTAE